MCRSHLSVITHVFFIWEKYSNSLTQKNPHFATKVLTTFIFQDDRDAKTIDERLLELHIEESLKDGQAWCSHLNPCANLLTLVRRRERFNRLLLTLNAATSLSGDDDGFYTVHVVTSEGKQTELLKLPYEEDDFLTCVDNQV